MKNRKTTLVFLTYFNILLLSKIALRHLNMNQLYSILCYLTLHYSVAPSSMLCNINKAENLHKSKKNSNFAVRYVNIKHTPIFTTPKGKYLKSTQPP
jgi:hypothetical protein